jgi:uncharacterized membrane protein YjgN (DUF898 family)
MQASSASGSPELPFRFTGSSAEFFRIWIVNLCLTVVTLGLYAPWAKVRTRRYFAGNLAVGDTRFDYDADPMRILIGRLIVLAVFGLYAGAQALSPAASFAFGIAFIFLFPLAAVRSTAFHHRHTLFRSIRFGFHAPYAEAFKVLVLGPMAATLSLGLALPWWYAKRQEFVARHSRYGTSHFGFEGRAGAYYGLFARASLPMLGAVLVSGVGVAPLLGAVQAGDRSSVEPMALTLGLAVALGVGIAVAIIQAGLTNLLYQNAWVGELRFRSELRAVPLAWIYVSSAIAVVLSLGLLVPWARVRMARYRASALSAWAPAGLDAFTQAATPEEGLGGLASEAADLFDFDLGL